MKKTHLVTFVALATFAVQDLSAANPAKGHSAEKKATSNAAAQGRSVDQIIETRSKELAEVEGALEINAAKLAKDLSPGGEQRGFCEALHGKKVCDEYAQAAQCVSASSKMLIGPSLLYFGDSQPKQISSIFNEMLNLMDRDATYSD